MNDEEFKSKFFDVRTSKMQKDQVLARFRAIAELVEGAPKRDLIKILKKGKIIPAIQFMKKIFCSIEADAYKVCRQILEDILAGSSDLEIEFKPYEYTYEALYYANKDDVPKDDPHWTVLGLNPEYKGTEFKDSKGNKYKIKFELPKK
jgi:hypothetical protein